MTPTERLERMRAKVREGGTPELHRPDAPLVPVGDGARAGGIKGRGGYEIPDDQRASLHQLGVELAAMFAGWDLAEVAWSLQRLAPIATFGATGGSAADLVACGARRPRPSTLARSLAALGMADQSDQITASHPLALAKEKP